MRAADRLALHNALKKKADETNDSHDHDELHAAAEIMVTGPREMFDQDNYISRWVNGLIELHHIQVGGVKLR